MKEYENSTWQYLKNEYNYIYRTHTRLNTHQYTHKTKHIQTHRYKGAADNE